MSKFRCFFISPENPHRLQAMALLIAAVLLSNWAWAADEPKDQQAENEPIQIVADELISYNEEKYAEFIGSVKATQADFTITSDKLRIYYRGELLESEKKDGDQELLKKIVATGNVKITSEEYDAEADQAEYDTDTGTVILSGENAKVVSGKNSITGSKITMNRKTGQVKVKGRGSKRIKALFYTEEDASEAFKMEKTAD